MDCRSRSDDDLAKIESFKVSFMDIGENFPLAYNFIKKI